MQMDSTGPPKMHQFNLLKYKAGENGARKPSKISPLFLAYNLTIMSQSSVVIGLFK